MTPEIQLNSSTTADISNPMAIAVLPRLRGVPLFFLQKLWNRELCCCITSVLFVTNRHSGPPTVQECLVMLMHMRIHRQHIFGEIPTMGAKHVLHEAAIGKLDFALP